MTNHSINLRGTKIAHIIWLTVCTLFFFFLQIDQINDPVVDSTYRDVWMATAKVGIVKKRSIIV